MIFGWLRRLLDGDMPSMPDTPATSPSDSRPLKPPTSVIIGAVRPSQDLKHLSTPARADSDFPLKLMGVSYYKHIIAGICGDRAPDGGLVKPARCVPDDNGIRVDIEGATVGYVMSSDAWVYAMMVREPVECRALIRGRLISGQGHPEEFTIRVDVVLPDLAPEIAAHRGCSYDCNVVGEANHQEELGEILARRAAEKPAPWVPRVTASLVREDQEPPSVRVEINGATVGRLSPGNARRYCGMLLLRPETLREVPALIGRGGRPWDSRRGAYDVSLELWLPTDLPDAARGYRKRPRR